MASYPEEIHVDHLTQFIISLLIILSNRRLRLPPPGHAGHSLGPISQAIVIMEDCNLLPALLQSEFHGGNRTEDFSCYVIRSLIFIYLAAAGNLELIGKILRIREDDRSISIALEHTVIRSIRIGNGSVNVRKDQIGINILAKFMGAKRLFHTACASLTSCGNLMNRASRSGSRIHSSCTAHASLSCSRIHSSCTAHVSLSCTAAARPGCPGRLGICHAGIALLLLPRKTIHLRLHFIPTGEDTGFTTYKYYISNFLCQYYILLQT